MKQLPVILITGFLGAGKTTFVNKLLSYLRESSKSVALLINEFGLVNIDSDLIDSEDEPVYEVNQGSIFCVCTRDQFLKALDGIANHSPSYDVVIIESTGLANTRDIGEYLSAEPFNNSLSIRQNFCIVDAKNFHKVLSTLPAIKSQVTEASVCVVNKTDLAEKGYLERIDEMLLSLNPYAEVVHTTYGKVHFDELINLADEWTASSELDQAPPENITSLSLNANGIYNRKKTISFLKKISVNLLRAKGFVEFEDGIHYVEIAGEVINVIHDRKEGRQQKYLVLIGHMDDTDLIKAAFKKCRISD